MLQSYQSAIRSSFSVMITRFTKNKHLTLDKKHLHACMWLANAAHDQMFNCVLTKVELWTQIEDPPWTPLPFYSGDFCYKVLVSRFRKECHGVMFLKLNKSCRKPPTDTLFDELCSSSHDSWTVKLQSASHIHWFEWVQRGDALHDQGVFRLQEV